MWISAHKERRIVENLRHLYTILQEYQDKKEKRILTVLKGPHAGEKAFFAGDGLLWERTGQGFFTEHREEAGAIRAEGQQELAGETVFCDCLGEAKKLVICGAGHVGVALLRMALLLGFDVTVLEDRPYFADGARRAGAKRVICDSFEQGLDAVDSDEDTYFVVMSRGHRYDLVCLEKIVKKTYAYLGMMGSKGRSALVRKNLLEQGVPTEQVEGLHAHNEGQGDDQRGLQNRQGPVHPIVQILLAEIGDSFQYRIQFPGPGADGSHPRVDAGQNLLLMQESRQILSLRQPVPAGFQLLTEISVFDQPLCQLQTLFLGETAFQGDSHSAGKAADRKLLLHGSDP